MSLRFVIGIPLLMLGFFLLANPQEIQKVVPGEINAWMSITENLSGCTDYKTFETGTYKGYPVKYIWFTQPACLIININAGFEYNNTIFVFYSFGLKNDRPTILHEYTHVQFRTGERPPALNMFEEEKIAYAEGFKLENWKDSDFIKNG